MCVKLALMCATDDGSGAQCVADCSRPLSPEAGRAGAKCYSAEPLSHEDSNTGSKKINPNPLPHQMHQMPWCIVGACAVIIG